MKYIYKCEYCNFQSENKIETELHEQQCKYNPIFKSCYTCIKKRYLTDNFILHLTTSCEEHTNIPIRNCQDNTIVYNCKDYQKAEYIDFNNISDYLNKVVYIKEDAYGIYE